MDQLHRFYMPPALGRDTPLCLSGREAHHALHVLRVHQGDRLTILDGAGQELLCGVRTASRDTLQLDLIQKTTHAPLRCRITLLQAIPKGKLFETIVQKATELGASRIVPILSERVVSKVDPEEAAHKTAKWRQVAIEAIKQCGSAWLPQIEPPLTPAQFLARGEKFELPLVAALESTRRHPREYFHGFYALNQRPPVTVSVWIGPEGDFTPAEMNTIKAAGVLPITLGPLVLRTETAAAYCLSILNYELQSPAG